ncbi:MarR family winged helix-turn-helix transcriptional regulator [Demequina globuliformis]|uniref:MarR family winged helix-turn-helix transcriptional regulator n=1 Tax=Demequina globuliformis TaxID=676202 RepID=UPI000785E08E|nr:MarR family winged helix-turn-helix transcriptional regulator [Demequina globuliformis]
MSDKITFTLHELVWELDHAADQHLREHFDITGSQFIFLATLLDVEPTDMTGLAHCLGTSKAAVSKRVPAFVEAGWISTSTPPGPGRRVLLELTPTARDLVARAGRALDDNLARLVAASRAQGIDLDALNADLNTLVALMRQNGASS